MLVIRFLPYLIWLIAPALTGVWAIALGQDANWDLRNYHFYNPFALLTGRENVDIAAGQVATYYNPLMHLPFYFAVQTLPPIAVAFLLGMLQGFNFPLLFLIARRVINVPNAQWGTYAALTIAALGLTGAGFRSEIGTSFGDNFVSLFFLGGILLVIDATDQRSPRRYISYQVVLAGLLVGAAAGLKQPSAIYAVGMCAALLFRDLQWRHNIASAFIFGCGVLLGMAATGGFWMWELWHRYGNPLFPYFNQIFQSPWATVGEYRDVRFVPQGMVDALQFPFDFMFAPLHMSEVRFVDSRQAVFYVVALLLAALMLRRLCLHRRHIEVSNERNANARYILGTIIVTFLVWLKIFAIHRYLIGIEIVLPLGIWLLLERIWRKASHIGIAFAVIAVVLLATTRTDQWGRVAFQSDYFGVDVPAIPNPQNTLVLMAGFEPMSYLIPFFPHELRFFRVQSWFTGPSATPNGFDNLMMNTVRSHRGDIFGLFKGYEQATADAAFQSYGYQRSVNNCTAMSPHIEDQNGKPMDQPFFFCKLEPLPTGDTRTP